MRRMYPLLLAALLALLLAGCGAANNEGATDVPKSTPSPVTSQGNEPSPTNISDPSSTPPPAESTGTDTQEPSGIPAISLENAAHEVVDLLRDRDLNSLSKWIHPELGLRFSPYSHINPDADLTFKADELPGFKSADKLVWGSFDGSGDPIELTFREYYEKFVYNQDFADAPNVNANKIMGTGNSEYNGADVYPGSSFVEFHFPGFDKKYEGMDWQNLILVFLPDGESWKLTAIVHGQWTI